MLVSVSALTATVTCASDAGAGGQTFLGLVQHAEDALLVLVLRLLEVHAMDPDASRQVPPALPQLGVTSEVGYRPGGVTVEVGWRPGVDIRSADLPRGHDLTSAVRGRSGRSGASTSSSTCSTPAQTKRSPRTPAGVALLLVERTHLLQRCERICTTGKTRVSCQVGWRVRRLGRMEGRT